MSKEKSGQKMKRTTEPVQLQYEMLVVGGYDNPDIEAELRSPALDPVMHPESVLHVNIDNEAKSKKGKPPRVLLDAFHIDSLNEYLRSQARVRQILAKELARDQEEWDPDGQSVAADPWASAKVLSLDLRRRNLPTPGRIAELKRLPFTPAEMKDILAGMDAPDTRSTFTVVLECDWDDEHQLKALFRDGEFMTLDHE